MFLCQGKRVFEYKLFNESGHRITCPRHGEMDLLLLEGEVAHLQDAITVLDFDNRRYGRKQEISLSSA
jgi:hypothetical protein